MMNLLNVIRKSFLVMLVGNVFAAAPIEYGIQVDVMQKDITIDNVCPSKLVFTYKAVNMGESLKYSIEVKGTSRLKSILFIQQPIYMQGHTGIPVLLMGSNPVAKGEVKFGSQLKDGYSYNAPVYCSYKLASGFTVYATLHLRKLGMKYI
jgi:hypothetical protein